MESLRPFIAQLQLARCQYNACKEATTPIAKLSFVRGGFYLLQALHKSWVQHQLQYELQHELQHELQQGRIDIASPTFEDFLLASNNELRIGSELLSDGAAGEKTQMRSPVSFPPSLISLQNSDWYPSFRQVLKLLEEPAAVVVAQDSVAKEQLIAVAQSSVSLTMSRLGSDIKGFEHYFESQLNLSEEY